MKMKLLINTRIIDPQNNIDEVGGILIDENGMEKEALALLQSRKDRGWYHMIEVGAGMTMEEISKALKS